MRDQTMGKFSRGHESNFLLHEYAREPIFGEEAYNRSFASAI